MVLKTTALQVYHSNKATTYCYLFDSLIFIKYFTFSSNPFLLLNYNSPLIDSKGGWAWDSQTTVSSFIDLSIYQWRKEEKKIKKKIYLFLIFEKYVKNKIKNYFRFFCIILILSTFWKKKLANFIFPFRDKLTFYSEIWFWWIFRLLSFSFNPSNFSQRI